MPRNRDLTNTPFSTERLIIWALGIDLILLSGAAIVLAYQDKNIMPIGTIIGTIIGYFSGRASKKGVR